MAIHRGGLRTRRLMRQRVDRKTHIGATSRSVAVQGAIAPFDRSARKPVTKCGSIDSATIDIVMAVR